MDKKNLICVFKPAENAGELSLCTVDEESKSKIDKFCYHIASENVSNYFKNVPEFIRSSVKAVIFNQLDNFHNPDFYEFSQFIRFIKTEFKKLEIPVRLIDGGDFSLTRLLVAAKINPKWNRNIIFIYVSQDTVFVEEIFRAKEGYMRPPIKKTQVFECTGNYVPEEIKAEILAEQKNQANKIYVAAFAPHSLKVYIEMIKLFGKENRLILNNENDNEYEAVIEIAKHLLDEKCNQYYVIPKFIITVKNTQDKFIYQLPCYPSEGLPSTISEFDERRRGEYYIARYYKDQRKSEVIQTYPFLKGQYHKIKLTLKVDKKLVPSLIQEPFIDPKIKELPRILTDKIDSKIPIIGLFYNSSVICLWNEKEKCYKFSKNWNGSYGEDLFISFDEEKPKYRNEAVEVLKVKPTYVVYDLLKILASKQDKKWINPDWSFAITKDDENPLLLKVDSYNGEGKLATPEFIMALLFKDHVKVIREEVGEKPKNLGVVFIDKFDNEFWDYSLLPEKIKESCSLIQLGCSIIDIDD